MLSHNIRFDVGQALANGRPTVVEFYADWCEVCREMAKDVYKVEEEYRYGNLITSMGPKSVLYKYTLKII